MTTNFNVEPYNDDFEADNGALENNYMRILFRPGYAVQARELTQIQTILQNQIKQFGNHVFQDGSPVIGGHLSIDNNVTYLKLDPQSGGSDVDVDDFINLTIFNDDNVVPKTRARVIQAESTQSERTLMIKYIRGSTFSPGQKISTIDGVSANVVVNPLTYTGTGTTVTINDGIFYAEGFFVKVPQQTIILSANSATPTFRVGLEIDEDIITENEDTALLDPAQESFNYQAPGAHRYKFNLVLAKRSLTSVDDERFYELLRVENGVITKQVSYPIYSELEKTLARRTYDESGDYVVKPFRVNISANTPAGSSENTSTFLVNVEPGKAYVRGFEFETVGTQKIPAQRARTYKDSLNYNLDVYYGNRIQVTNVKGGDEGINFSKEIEPVDIHCVPENEVTLNGNTHNYGITKIGEARVKNFDRAGSVNDYFMYLTDIEFSPIVALTRTNSLYFNEIYFPTYFSSLADAYVGGTVTILNGDAAGESSIITGYNGTSKLALLSVDFSTPITSGTQFSLSMPFSSAKGFVRPDTTSYLSADSLFRANVSKESKDVIGNAILQDTQFNKNIFELPNYYIRYDSDANVNLYRRIIRRAQFVANGSYSFGLSSPEDGSFDFGSNSQEVSTAAVNENIIVVPVEGPNTGNVLNMTTAGRSVFRGTSQQIDINTNTGSGNTFYADVIVTTKLTAIENTKRVKTLKQSNTAITTNDVPATAAAVVGKPEVKINLANGVVWFMAANAINKIPNEPQSLCLSDVIKINKIYDSGNISHAPNTTNKIDITDRYIFSSGQTDQYYDHASITLKPGAIPPAGQTAVFLDYFQHSGYGYLAASSYDQTLYDNEQIPIYKSSTGKLFNLRDCIDMRPVRNPGTTTDPTLTINLSPTVNVASGSMLVQANTNRLYANVLTPPLLTGSTITINGEKKVVASVVNAQAIMVTTPFTNSATNTSIALIKDNKKFGNVEVFIQRPTDPLEIDYAYYLPRQDSLILTKNKEFKILTGVPSLSPEPPTLNEEAMTLYNIKIPAYTSSLSSIDLQYIDNRRYTMKDIGEIDQRLKEVEDYIKLKESEIDIINNPPKSPATPTVNKPVYGTLVDEFNDLSVADTSKDFAASIENGKLSCFKKNITLGLKPAGTNDVAHANKFDKFITLEYTEVPAVSQKYATEQANTIVQTAVIGKFEGFVSLTPESDYYFSTEHQPLITDSLGRFFEINQQSRTPDPAITDQLIETIGGGRYVDDLYLNPVVLGWNVPINRQNFLNIPNYANDPSSYEPKVTSAVPIRFDGTAFDTYTRQQWSGTGGGGSIINPIGNAYTPGWLDSNKIVSGSRLTIDETYGARRDLE